ncbi:hypothetical protein BCh11DRAFT_07622 [Burkholderia sp. Ch1-1]|nr:hypothetical protein BCh11DRAFT_07622 [Burkholderia sp. Ch1-1]
MRALNHPAMPAQPFFALDATPGNARRDPALFQVLPATGEVVTLVRMQFLRTFAGLPTQAGHCGYRINRALERYRIVPVRTRHRDRQGNASGIYDEVSFVPGLPLSVGLGPLSWPPGGWQRWPHPRLPVPSQSGHARATGEASPDAACPPRPRPASPASVASKSCRYRNPVPAVGLPKEYLFAGHTECCSMQPTRQPCVGDRLWAMG